MCVPELTILVVPATILALRAVWISLSGSEPDWVEHAIVCFAVLLPFALLLTAWEAGP